MGEIYIYENIEVHLTGRFAKRGSEESNQHSTKNLLCEITPVDENQGTWKKWVSFATLYKVFTVQNYAQNGVSK